jgi:hypothetical protein
MALSGSTYTLGRNPEGMTHYDQDPDQQEVLIRLASLYQVPVP